MKIILSTCLLLCSFSIHAQDYATLFTDWHVSGSASVFDYKNNKWLFTNEQDAGTATLPASTFKIINLLIALETKVIKNENEIVKWPGKTDTTLYGYRPEIYHDMTVKEAFEVSAGWVFVELAKRIGKKQYARYLSLCNYGNGDLSQKDEDFWNFGNFAISPKNQVEFMVKLYKEKLPFSKKNISILKKVMLTESTATYQLRSKTGWTRVNGLDIGWWVGYVERNDNVYFFATRISKNRSDYNPQFAECRKSITRKLLREMHALD